MAYLSIDKNRIELIVKVGILEEYSPDIDIEEIFEEVENLKKKLKQNRNRIVGKSKSNKHALEILQQDEIKTKKWQDYINNTYAKQLEIIQKKINKKNMEICPNFKEIMDKKSS